MSRLVSAVRTHEDGERIFLANRRRSNPNHSYTYTLGSALLNIYRNYNGIEHYSYWFNSGSINWFENQ